MLRQTQLNLEKSRIFCSKCQSDFDNKTKEKIEFQFEYNEKVSYLTTV